MTTTSLKLSLNSVKEFISFKLFQQKVPTLHFCLSTTSLEEFGPALLTNKIFPVLDQICMGCNLQHTDTEIKLLKNNAV